MDGGYIKVKCKYCKGTGFTYPTQFYCAETPSVFQAYLKPGEKEICSGCAGHGSIVKKAKTVKL